MRSIMAKLQCSRRGTAANENRMPEVRLAQRVDRRNTDGSGAPLYVWLVSGTRNTHGYDSHRAQGCTGEFEVAEARHTIVGHVDGVAFVVTGVVGTGDARVDGHRQGVFSPRCKQLSDRIENKRLGSHSGNPKRLSRRVDLGTDRAMC